MQKITISQYKNVKPSFYTPENMLKFIVFKRLIKMGFKLYPKKEKYNSWIYFLK